MRHSIPEVGTILEIYHLACPASPDYFGSNPVDILETCFTGTKNMLDMAVTNNAKILIASTSEIYGDPKVIPQGETYWGNTNSFGPRSCYDEGKRITEALAYGYQRKYGLQVRIARIFNAYGPSMKMTDGRAVPNFIAAAMQAEPIHIYGDGSATRCFQFVSDCVRGLVALMKSDYSNPVNIGSDVETSINDIAKLVTELVAQKLKSPTRLPIKYLPKREDDPYRRKPDISLAKKELDWKPMVELHAGLDITVEWFLLDKVAHH
ncbi:UDP-glucuronic acid decarboxylase 1 [Cadophora gregata f. sp. sojae]|nr:UDP-glucuronic acid decarboxylase 1 [Cadophora gregata f. sp. sojae]